MLENVIVVTFSGSRIHREYQKEFHELYGNNFGGLVEYTHLDIMTTDFYRENMQMFQYKKYFGYFLWKPYIIKTALDLYPGHNVLYCDSNLRFTNFPEFEKQYNFRLNHPLFLIRHEHYINKDWTKRDTFFCMDADNERYWNAHQVWTPLVGFNHTTISEQVLDDYLFFCSNPQIVVETPSLNGEELPGFKEHRWEQSVLSILVERYKLQGIPDTLVMNWVTKYYSDDLMKMKEEINKDPLAKV